MTSVLPGRLPPSNRVQGTTPSTSGETVSKVVSFLSPVAGLVTADPLSRPTMNSATLMENFWCTTSGIEPRGGTRIRVRTGSPVRRMFGYHAGDIKRNFVCSRSKIFSFTNSEEPGSLLKPDITGRTHGEYGVCQVHNQGGTFLTIFNGADIPIIYDGKKWSDVVYEGDVSANELAFAWSYRNRQFMIQKNSMNVWYLGTNSIGGRCTKLPLGGIFSRGGSLLFGATWSSDSGSGMDDRCVFTTTSGESAVYTGEPSDQSWSLVGVFDIGAPLGKNAHFNIGGDLIIATKDGLIPMGSVARTDVSKLKVQALTRPIEPTWRQEVVLAEKSIGWSVQKWSSRNMLVISPPAEHLGEGYCFAVNLETGAWTKFTNWLVGDFGLFDDVLHYGDLSGNVFTCDSGGTDGGVPFECKVCSCFYDMGTPAHFKILNAIEGKWKFNTPIRVKHSVSSDFRIHFPSVPNAAIYSGGSEGEWDVSFWDQDFWAKDETSYNFDARWISVGRTGRNFAYQVQLLSASSVKLDCELLSVDMTYSQGGFLV